MSQCSGTRKSKVPVSNSSSLAKDRPETSGRLQLNEPLLAYDEEGEDHGDDGGGGHDDEEEGRRRRRGSPTAIRLSHDLTLACFS